MPRIAPPLAFWDTSALVKIFVSESGTEAAFETFLKDEEIAVWRGTPTELVFTFERRRKTGESPAEKIETAREELLELLTEGALTIVTADDEVRHLSFALLARQRLKAADSLQLAAALLLRNRFGGVTFRSEDLALRAAASAEGLAMSDTFAPNADPRGKATPKREP